MKADVLANNSGADGDVLEAFMACGPEHDRLYCNDDGSYTYRPASGYTGTDTFTYAVSVGTFSTSATITLDVGHHHDDDDDDDGDRRSQGPRSQGSRSQGSQDHKIKGVRSRILSRPSKRDRLRPMSRPLRIEFAGALYHVTSRGDRREDIYLDDEDRKRFLEVFAEVCDRHRWTCHAYCLMSNHYHLLVETHEATLGKGMRQLNGVFTQRFNRRHHRVGHVFQGRYKAILVDKDSYLLELARYIVLNPTRAAMVRSARDWPWSSYRATAGFAIIPVWLNVDWLLSAFGRRRGPAMEAYRRFVSEGRDQSSPWHDLKQQMYLGDDAFVEDMQAKVKTHARLDEIPSTQRRPPPLSLERYQHDHANRDEAIIAAYASGGYSMKAIGEHFELHYSMISLIVRKARNSRFKT